MALHINIPIFIPHEGCPNNCVFCNQHTITGKTESADRDIKKEIDIALSTYTGLPENAEIAFFGGSFTGIDRNLMIRLLDDADEYVRNGKVSSIRLSTRPDYIDTDILNILKERHVTDIELGIQSMSDKVLSLSKRNHLSETTRNACKLILDYGFTLTGQMMIGLPQSSLEDEIYTAEEIVKMGCTHTRIYPTVVFNNTELCEMAKKGIYTPLSVDEAVKRSAKVYEIFVKNNVHVLRIGLQSTDALVRGEDVYAGANHSALGELVIGEYYYQIIKNTCLMIFEKNKGKNLRLVLTCAPGEESKVAGQKKKNKSQLEKFAQSFGVHLNSIKIIPSKDVMPNTVKAEYNY